VAHARAPGTVPGLQRALGNRAVGQLLRAEGGAGPTGLDVSAPGDRCEQEADRLSGEVMRMAEPRSVSSAAGTGGAGGSTAAPVRRKPAGAKGAVAQAAPASVHDVLAAPGRPLDAASRGFMEPRFGHDLGGVRVHTGAAADAAADAVQARAFTVGDDVVFGRGEFAPHGTPGRALLAHELAHVVQGGHGEPQLMRQPVETHYPTADEQRAIEKALARDFGGTEAPAPVEGAPAPTRGRSITEAERDALAARLKPDYFSAIAALDAGGTSGPGGMDEAGAFAVAEEARTKIFEKFGSYAFRQIALTRDETTTRTARHRDDQVLVIFHAPPELVDSVARTLVTTHCPECKAALSDLDSDSSLAVVERLKQAALAERADLIRRVTDKRVPGAYNRFQSRAILRIKPRDELLQTAVHELIHALAHPAFSAAFGDEDYVNEGFTEYFTQQVIGGGINPAYQEQYNKVIAARDTMKGPFVFSSVFGKAAEESMRQAYFRGRLDLIGWRPSDSGEEADVKAADPTAKAWDATTAARYAGIYQEKARAKQDASSNVLGMGLVFNRQGDATVSVSYARVVKVFDPLSRGRLLVDASALASPAKPQTLGGSLGIAAEYQEPYLYAQGGVRFSGTAALSGDPARLDVSPFVGVGLRLWQTVRLGPEIMVAFPVTGQGVQFAGGVKLGFEFGRQ
jgi:hypothetical protein